jgi:hypothetical protein
MGWAWSLVTKHLTCNHKALGSISSTEKSYNKTENMKWSNDYLKASCTIKMASDTFDLLKHIIA